MKLDRHPLLANLPVSAGPVILRALHPGDVDDFLAYRSDPAVARFQTWQPTDRAAAQAFLQGAVPSPWREGEWTQIGMAGRGEDRLVGDIGLLLEAADRVQIGFSLERSAQGKGWARAAVQACITSLLVPLNVVCVRGITDERNGGSDAPC